MAAADTLDGFMRYDAFPQMAWAARSLPVRHRSSLLTVPALPHDALS